MSPEKVRKRSDSVLRRLNEDRVNQVPFERAYKFMKLFIPEDERKYVSLTVIRDQAQKVESAMSRLMRGVEQEGDKELLRFGYPADSHQARELKKIRPGDPFWTSEIHFVRKCNEMLSGNPPRGFKP